MTYSQGSPGYQPAQPTTQFAAPTQQFGKADEGPSKLPVYLTAAVAVLGLAVYLSSFGPYFTGTIGAELFTPIPLYIGIVAAILAGLLAAVSLVPKQSANHAVVAVLAVLGFLLVIALVITAPEGVSIDWGLYLIIAFTALQAIVAVTALLFDAGVISLAGAAAEVRPAAAVRPVRRPGRVLRAAARPARSTSRRSAAAPAASGIPEPVRRSAGRAVHRRILGAPAERAPHAAHRFPDLRPAAAVLGSDHPGSGATAAVVFSATVRPDAVVIRAARASISRV